MMASTEHGFSLIGVLISVFVLAVGVIGAAGMQLTALRTTQQSVFQTKALHLATEMADKMRANVTQMQLDDAINPYLRVDYQASLITTSHQSTHHCYGTDTYCDSGQLASFDIERWLRRIDSELPGGRVRICRDAEPWNTANRHFNWDCVAANGMASIASLVIKIGWSDKNHDGKSTGDGGKTFAPTIVLTVAPYAQ